MNLYRVARAVTATLAACAGTAHADVVYTFQDRAISAELTSNGAMQTIAATNFGPFNEMLNLENTIVTPGGAPALNAARVGIDCQLDPNAIRVIGSLAGSGGVSVVGGVPTLQMGEAEARVETLMLVPTPTAIRVTASPRASTRPGDRYQIKIKNKTTGVTLLDIDETMPPQAVDFRGVLSAHEWEVEFQTEMTFDGPEDLRDFFFNVRLGTCYANCDDSTAIPELNVNDFVCFLGRYAAGDSRANCDGSTAAPVLNVNDFNCFLQAFATGCN